MKSFKLNIHILIALLIVVLMGCEDTFLKENNYNKIIPGEYYSTATGVKSGINGLYGRLRYFYTTEFAVNMCENNTDMFVPPMSTGYMKIDPNTGFVRDFWNACYITINQCNTVIYALEKTSIAGLPDSLKVRYLGEARFIRAHFYDHLVKQFGDVPMPLVPTEGIVTTSYRTPTDSVWRQIIADLNYAVLHLPESYKPAEYGRVTRYAAMQNLAKVLLTARRSDLTSVRLALNYADTILNSGRYTLAKVNDLWDITKQRTPDVIQEIIFPVLYSKDVILNGDGNRAHLYFVSAYSNQHEGVIRSIEYGRGWDRLKPTKYAYRMFLNPKVDMGSKGKLLDARGTAWFQTQWNINREAGYVYSTIMYDPFLKVNREVYQPTGSKGMIAPYWNFSPEDCKAVWPVWVFLPDSMKPVVGDDIQSLSKPTAKWPSNVRFFSHLMFPYINKYLDPTRPDVNYEAGSKDVFVYRIAETYLIAAEAAYLLGDMEASRGYLNIVRKRAERDDPDAPDMLDQMAIKRTQVSADFILDERGRELIGELNRWYDLKRFGKLEERMKWPDIYYDNPVSWYNYWLRPIPREQLLRITNPQDFPQNPGYSN
jgi:starch-binding outer membrane protein, SusD/RagB family